MVLGKQNPWGTYMSRDFDIGLGGQVNALVDILGDRELGQLAIQRSGRGSHLDNGVLMEGG